MSDPFLKRAYKIDNQADTNALYTDWAESYDQSMITQGYVTPERCVAALKQFLPLDARILDIGCGTGFSGMKLREGGFVDVHGSEPNPKMIEIAKKRNVYSKTYLSDLENQFPFDPGKYKAITAMGVISTGAGPASLLRDALMALSPDGLVCFSLNEHALAVPEYPEMVAEVVANGLAANLFEELGTHMKTIGSQSKIYVLKRL